MPRSCLSEMISDFSSVWAKICRAEEHISTFEKELAAWVSTNPYRLTIKHNTDFSRCWALVRVIHEPSLERWSLIVSDAIHNLRCSLDHLIYAVAIVRTEMNPPPGARDWSFPIRSDSSLQVALKDDPFPKLGPSVLEEIKRFQPYNRPHPRLPPILALLNRFDNLDKHRLLRVAMVHPREGKWEWSPNPEFPGARIVPTLSEVVDSTKVSELIFQGPSKESYPKFSANLVISLFPLSGEKPIEVSDMLPEMASEVRLIVEQIISVL